MRILFLFILLSPILLRAQSFVKGELIYSNNLQHPSDTSGWRMEGNGALLFSDSGMQMFSPARKEHHVLWCPQSFPDAFIAEWEAKNLDPSAGLCIVFFAAAGTEGQDLFDPQLPERNGVFTQYTNGAIRNYHISYYANPRNEPGREKAHLRKNPGFYKVQDGQDGIPLQSENFHKLRLIYRRGEIQMFVDSRMIIDWKDDASHGAPFAGGKIGFRQMKWTNFLYRNLKVWAIKE